MSLRAVSSVTPALKRPITWRKYAVRAAGGAPWMEIIAQMLLRPISWVSFGTMPTTVYGDPSRRMSRPSGSHDRQITAVCHAEHRMCFYYRHALFQQRISTSSTRNNRDDQGQVGNQDSVAPLDVVNIMPRPAGSGSGTGLLSAPAILIRCKLMMQETAASVPVPGS